MEDGVEGGLGGHWPQSLRYENSASDLFLADVPFGEGLGRGERKIAVEVFEGGGAHIFGPSRGSRERGKGAAQGEEAGSEGGAHAFHRVACLSEFPAGRED
jgi:hypothetical protein